jgi:formylglycine-generating enzyme required for sulfatase activity
MQTDARGITWVRVCGGTFAMGSPPSEDAHIDTYAREWADAGGWELEQLRDYWRGWLALERPRHPVLLDDFWMARTELTPAQAGTGDGDLPLVDIDWAGARDTCATIGGRLATEAEWEYAARAGSAERWSFGDDPAALGDHAWYRGNADDKAHPVGRRQPNGLCLADLHGNVYEWVADCFDAGAYAGRAPLAIDPLVAPSACERRVVRGGSFLFPPFLLRSACRDDVRPALRDALLGLRCVRSGARQP